MNMCTPETVREATLMHTHSILDSPVSRIHRIAGAAESAEGPDTPPVRRAPTRRAAAARSALAKQAQDQQGQQDQPVQERRVLVPAPSRSLDDDDEQVDLDRLPFTIQAQVNAGFVDFRVRGKDAAVTFAELAAACAQQLPGVVLERRTKWLQRTFDLWSHAGQCLYSIPIASQPEPAGGKHA